jgi:hypothetical protein
VRPADEGVSSPVWVPRSSVRSMKPAQDPPLVAGVHITRSWPMRR